MAPRHLPSSNGSFKCSIFGDMGVNGSAPTIDLLRQHPEHEFILHAGDVSYADDYHDEYAGGRGYEDIYDQFGTMVEPLSASKPYMVSPGNHDVSCNIYDHIHTDCIPAHRNFSAFNHRWRMPSAESGSGSNNMWYSFTVQRTHFVSINTESDYPGAPTTPHTLAIGGRGGGFGDQLGWLEADLRRALHERPLSA